MPPEQSLSVSKAIAILKVVGGAPDALSTSEIVGRVGLGKTAVLRILATLTAHKLLERDSRTNGYRLGNAFVSMAQTALRQHPLLLRASSLLEEIVSVTSDCGLMMVEDGGMSLCIEVKNGTYPISIGTEIGTRSPLHCGGGPFALLAFAPDSFIEEYLSKPLEAPTPRTVTKPRKVWERIREARERGFTIGDEDLFEYVVAVGLPIFDHSGRLMGSISIGSINHRYSEARRLEVASTLLELGRKHLQVDVPAGKRLPRSIPGSRPGAGLERGCARNEALINTVEG
ncbi:MAG: IclR family transcriptional regulator [Gemmatimonadales bacterium]